MKRKSSAVQRNLPRPTDMNQNILRPADMQQPLSEYQRAEEMIKEEMLMMLHHDSLVDPTSNQLGPAYAAMTKKQPNALNKAHVKPLNFEKHQKYIKEHGGYDDLTLEELENVNSIHRYKYQKILNSNKKFFYF